MDKQRVSGGRWPGPRPWPFPRRVSLCAHPDLPHRGLPIPDSHRDRGLHFVAGAGSGKSLTLGHLAFSDFRRRVPQVLFDPTGQMIDAFLLRVAQVPEPLRQHIWPSIRYIDMSGRNGRIAAWPLLFELPGDSRKDIADRFLETCRTTDPQLQSASIQGYNALYRVGAPVGMILSSLGLQLDSALDLLDAPEQWLNRLDEAERRYPEVHEAVNFIRNQYMPLSQRDRQSLTNSYRAKLEPIMLDPALRATLCTAPAGIDFAEVIRRQQTVLLDFREETNPRVRLLKTRWVYDTLLAYIRHRGPGRHLPLAIHFDEITELTNQASLDQHLFAADLDYLFNVLQRNYSLWITAAHQQMWHLAPKTQETLLAMGTQFFGSISDMDTAEKLAQRYRNLSLYRVKCWQDVWMSASEDDYVVEKKRADFLLGAGEFMNRRPFSFLVKPRHEDRLMSVSLAPDMGDPWPNEHPEALEYIRYQLALCSSRPISLCRRASREEKDARADFSRRAAAIRFERAIELLAEWAIVGIAHTAQEIALDLTRAADELDQIAEPSLSPAYLDRFRVFSERQLARTYHSLLMGQALGEEEILRALLGFPQFKEPPPQNGG